MFTGVDSAQSWTAEECRVAKQDLNISFIGRYVFGGQGKGITEKEARTILDAGIAILLIYENNWDDYMQGASKGYRFGEQVKRELESYGVPPGTCVYFCCDPASEEGTDIGHPNPNDYDNIEAYFRAVRETIAPYSLGIYAPYYTIMMAKEREICDCFWECCGGSWNGKEYMIAPFIHCFQSEWSGSKGSLRVANYLKDKTGIYHAVDMNEANDLTAARFWLPGNLRYVSRKNQLILVGDSTLKDLYNAAGQNNYTWISNFDWSVNKINYVVNKSNENTAICIFMNPNGVEQHEVQFYVDKIKSISEKVNEKQGSLYIVSSTVLLMSKKEKDAAFNLNATLGRQIAEARGAAVRYVSSATCKNTKLEKFNQSLRNGLDTSIGYIDAYSAVQNACSSVEITESEAFKVMYDLVLNTALMSTWGSYSSMYVNSSPVGGVCIDVDYMNINPYLITIDRNTKEDEIDFDKLQEARVVGAVLEYGALYDPYHVKYSSYKQPKFEKQKKLLDSKNLEYGYLVTTRARSIEEAASELEQMVSILRSRPPRLGVWVRVGLGRNKVLNNSIITKYQKVLIDLGFKQKIGLYLNNQMLEYISWDKYQDEWLLWLEDHVEEKSDLEQLLTPEFFDVTN